MLLFKGALDRVVSEERWKNTWKSKFKFLILITDSPSHGTEFTNGALVDNFPDGSPKGISTKSVMQKLLFRNIEFICGTILNQTKQMETVFEQYYNNSKENKKMSVIRLVDEKAIASSNVIIKHFIFLLDESNSMRGTPWNELRSAYNNFIDIRQKSQSIIDYISVITYNSSVKPLFIRESVLNAKNRLGDFYGGRSKYSPNTPAFQEAQKIVSAENEAQPIIIFMSDGGAEDPTAYIKNRLMTPFQRKGLKIYSLPFGNADLSNLNKIASIGGTLAAKTEINCKEFETVYNGFGTINKFAEHIGHEISKKLLEYL